MYFGTWCLWYSASRRIYNLFLRYLQFIITDHSCTYSARLLEERMQDTKIEENCRARETGRLKWAIKGCYLNSSLIISPCSGPKCAGAAFVMAQVQAQIVSHDVSVPGSTIDFQTAPWGSEKLPLRMTTVSKLIHSHVEKQTALTNSPILSSPVFPTWPAGSFCGKIGVTEVTSPMQYLNCSIFCGAEWGNVSGDLINT